MNTAPKTQRPKRTETVFKESAAAVEEALKVSGLSEEELARRLTLSVSTLRRIRKGYQPARSATLEVLQQIAAKQTSQVAVDLARMSEFVADLYRNRDIISQLKDLLDDQITKAAAFTESTRS